jgi:hypothetical protein
MHTDRGAPGAFLIRIFVGNGQFGAAFSAAGGKYSATVGRRHAFTKTVFVFSLAVRRLKCPFHLSAVFIIVIYLKFGLQM